MIEENLIPASIFFGGLLIGAQGMQRAIGVPASLVTAINGLIVVFVVSSQLWARRRAKKRASTSPPSPNQPQNEEQVSTGKQMAGEA